MVNHSSTALDETYAALAHATRRTMLDRLRDAPLRVTDLAAPFDITLPAASKHIRVLEGVGLVHRDVVGRDHVMSLRPRPLLPAAEWIDTYREFWSERLDALADHLRNPR